MKFIEHPVLNTNMTHFGINVFDVVDGDKELNAFLSFLSE